METKAVNLKTAARMLSIHPQTLKLLIDQGRIHSVRVNRRYLVPLAEIDRFLGQAVKTA